MKRGRPHYTQMQLTHQKKNIRVAFRIQWMSILILLVLVKP